MCIEQIKTHGYRHPIAVFYRAHSNLKLAGMCDPVIHSFMSGM